MAAFDGSRLLEPIKLGQMSLSHRMVLAPLTRFRAEDDHTPQLPLMAEYYAQRACVPGTLLVSEATFISPRAGGYKNVPGIWNDAHIQAWRTVTDAVHARGSYIYCQLWALGRTSEVANLAAEGFDLVSSSATPLPSTKYNKNPPVPRALGESEIWGFIEDYAQAARNAIAAGFDGVEIHGANGYLVDQFQQSTCNTRTDAWGGSVEARARFCLEVANACAAAVGPDRVGIRFSPWNPAQGMRMPDPIPQFTHAVTRLRELGLAYIHVVEARIAGNVDIEATESLKFMLDAWCGGTSSARQSATPLIFAGGYTPESAAQMVDREYPDAPLLIAFGRIWIANPDLAFRVRTGVPLTKYNRKTFYLPKSPTGYIDYPFSEEWVSEEGRESRQVEAKL